MEKPAFFGGQKPETCPSNEREARAICIEPVRERAGGAAARHKPVRGEETASLERHLLSLASGLRPSH